MKLRHILTAAAATFALATSSAAFARDYDHDQGRHYGERHDRDGDRDDNHHSRHHRDRGYHTGFYGHRPVTSPYVSHERVRFILSSHHFSYGSNPYWYHGKYVVLAYDRHGRPMLVRIDPYSGAWQGIAVRL